MYLAYRTQGMDPIIELDNFSLEKIWEIEKNTTSSVKPRASVTNFDRIIDGASNIKPCIDARQLLKYASLDCGDSSGAKEICSAVRVNIEGVASHNSHAVEAFLASRVGDENRAASMEEVDDTNAFLIFNLLTRNQCDHIIATAEPYLAPLDHLYEQRTRKADRALIRSPLVADELFAKVLPLLDPERDYVGRTPLCFGHDGVWAPFGMNECIKVFRYKPGGEFVPHRDGPWVPRQDQCSMYTLVVYLNDNFLGGTTALAGTCEYCEPGGRKICNWERDDAMLSVVPVTGAGLLLNHDCWHASQKLIDGTKWILRTELIFHRVHSFYVDRDAFANHEDYREARALYHASMDAAAIGDRKTFFETYQRVVHLQREAMLATRVGRKKRLLSVLGIDEFSAVLSFVPLRHIVGLLRLNRETYADIIRAPVWHDKLRSISLVDNSCSSQNDLIESLVDSAEPRRCHRPLELGGFYFSAFRQTVWLRKQFAPCAVFLLDSGVVLARPTCDNRRPGFKRRFRGAYRPEFEVCPPLDGSSLSLLKTRRYYTSWRFGYPVHMNQPLGERFEATDEDHGHPDNGGYEIVSRSTGKVAWSVLTCAIESAVETADTPLLIVTHPAASSNVANTRREAENALYGLSSSPAVAFLHPAICAILGAASQGYLADAPSYVVELRYGFTLVDGHSFGCSDPQDLTHYWFEVRSSPRYVVKQLGSATGKEIEEATFVPLIADLCCIDCDPRIAKVSGERYEELSEIQSEKPGTITLPLAETLSTAFALLLANPKITRLFSFPP